MAINFLFGTPERTQQFQLKTPQQQGLQNQAIGGAGNLLQQLLGNKFDFCANRTNKQGLTFKPSENYTVNR